MVSGASVLGRCLTTYSKRRVRSSASTHLYPIVEVPNCKRTVNILWTYLLKKCLQVCLQSFKAQKSPLPPIAHNLLPLRLHTFPLRPTDPLKQIQEQALLLLSTHPEPPLHYKARNCRDAHLPLRSPVQPIRQLPPRIPIQPRQHLLRPRLVTAFALALPSQQPDRPRHLQQKHPITHVPPHATRRRPEHAAQQRPPQGDEGRLRSPLREEQEQVAVTRATVPRAAAVAGAAAAAGIFRGGEERGEGQWGEAERRGLVADAGEEGVDPGRGQEVGIVVVVLVAGSVVVFFFFVFVPLPRESCCLVYWFRQ